VSLLALTLCLAILVPAAAEAAGPDLTGLAAVIAAVTAGIVAIVGLFRRTTNQPATEGQDVTTRVLELAEDLERARARCDDLRRENLELRARIDRRSEPR